MNQNHHQAVLSALIDVNARIPKKLYQMWLNPKDDAAGPPAKYQTDYYMGSMQKQNPDFDYKVWNMADVKQFFLDYPDVAQKYEKFYFHGLKYHIERCDFIRYLIMWKLGGVYCDLDYSCRRPLWPVLKDRCFAWCSDWSHAETLTLGSFENRLLIHNGFLASAPNQLIWPMLCDFIMHRYKLVFPGLIIPSTGPEAVGSFATLYGISDEFAFPEFYINRCLVQGKGFMAPQHELNSYPCSNDPPLLETTYVDGSNWHYDGLHLFAVYYVQRKHVQFIILLILLLLLLAIVFRKRSTELTACQMKVETCQNKTKPNLRKVIQE
jgi:hypothetical protein